MTEPKRIVAPRKAWKGHAPLQAPKPKEPRVYPTGHKEAVQRAGYLTLPQRRAMRLDFALVAERMKNVALMEDYLRKADRPVLERAPLVMDFEMGVAMGMSPQTGRNLALSKFLPEPCGFRVRGRKLTPCYTLYEAMTYAYVICIEGKGVVVVGRCDRLQQRLNAVARIVRDKIIRGVEPREGKWGKRDGVAKAVDA